MSPLVHLGRGTDFLEASDLSLWEVLVSDEPLGAAVTFL